MYKQHILYFLSHVYIAVLALLLAADGGSDMLTVLVFLASAHNGILNSHVTNSVPIAKCNLVYTCTNFYDIRQKVYINARDAYDFCPCP